MEELSQLIQSLVIIVMLAVFLELLLPRGNMQGYIKMVMGLLVIIAVLQMVSKFCGTDFNLYVPEIYSSPIASLEQVQSEALKISDHYKDQAIEDYRQGIIKQMLALARLNQELEVLDTWVEVDTIPGENFGKIQLARLTVSDKQQVPIESSIVPPVEITVGAKTSDEILQEQIPRQVLQQMQNLAETVADFYNLSEDQVQVIYIDQSEPKGDE